MSAFARAAVHKVTGGPVRVFESASDSSAPLGERQPGEELSVMEVRGEWLRIKATATSKGGWVMTGGELVPSVESRGSITLQVYHPEKEEKVKLCDVSVQPDETLGRVCELIEELTGLKESSMIPVEGLKTDLQGYVEHLPNINLPKINWVACSKTKAVGELYADKERFMYTYIGEVDAVLYPDYAEGSIRRFSTLESGESWKDAVAAEEEEEDGDGTGGADFVPISAPQE